MAGVQIVALPLNVQVLIKSPLAELIELHVNGFIVELELLFGDQLVAGVPRLGQADAAALKSMVTSVTASGTSVNVNEFGFTKAELLLTVKATLLPSGITVAAVPDAHTVLVPVAPNEMAPCQAEPEKPVQFNVQL